MASGKTKIPTSSLAESQMKPSPAECLPAPNEQTATVIDPFPPIVDADTFLETEFPDEPEVIQGVATLQSLILISAPSKAGKTWICTHAAAAASNGDPWQGFRTSKGKVLYINLELKERTFQSRLRAIKRALCVKSLPNLKLWHLRGKRADYLTLFAKIKERIAGQGFILIIIDPIYKIYGGLSENVAEEMATLCNALNQLSMDLNTAIMIATHHPKGNQAGRSAIDRISGSGVLARAADALIDFSPHQEEGFYCVERTCGSSPLFSLLLSSSIIRCFAATMPKMQKI